MLLPSWVRGNKGGLKLAEAKSRSTVVLAFRRQVLKAGKGEAATLFICHTPSNLLTFPASYMILVKTLKGVMSLWTPWLMNSSTPPHHLFFSRTLTSQREKALWLRHSSHSGLNLFPFPCMFCKPESSLKDWWDSGKQFYSLLFLTRRHRLPGVWLQVKVHFIAWWKVYKGKFLFEITHTHKIYFLENLSPEFRHETSISQWVANWWFLPFISHTHRKNGRKKRRDREKERKGKEKKQSMRRPPWINIWFCKWGNRTEKLSGFVKVTKG